jgi:uncharacterized protein YndB with AHSA1/START domain
VLLFSIVFVAFDTDKKTHTFATVVFIAITLLFMTNLIFTIEILAPADKVWFILWDDKQYRQWTAPFCEGSYAISDWEEGSRVHFLSPSGEGMYSVIETCVPNHKMFFKHIGELKDKIEQPLDENSQQWTGARENYTLTEDNGRTTLVVEMDVVDSHLDYFKNAFPKGLEKVKELTENPNIIIETEVAAPIEKVWDYWTNPLHISQWNHASEEWHTPHAENDLRVGGEFLYRMEAKDGSFGFDFIGVYQEIIPFQRIHYILGDGRKVTVLFSIKENLTTIREIFEPENMHPWGFQKSGWEAILMNFKKYIAG